MASIEELIDDAGRKLAHVVLFGENSKFPDFTPEQIVYRLRLTRKTGRFELPDGEVPPPGTVIPGRP